MKNRRRVEVHTGFTVRHPVVEMIDIGLDVCVGHGHAFGMARCAARIDESQDRVRVVDWVGIGSALRV